MTKILTLPDMTCGHCKAAVEKALSALDASARIAVDLETKRVDLDTVANDADVLAALKAAGYDATFA